MEQTRHQRITHLGDLAHNAGEWAATVAFVFALAALLVAGASTLIEVILLNH